MVIAHPVLHDSPLLVSASLASTPDAPSPSEPAPAHISENIMDAPLIDNDLPALASFHPAHQPAVESPSNSSSSPDSLAAAGATLDVDTSARTMPPAILATSISSLSIPSTGAVSHQNNTVLAHSDALNVPSSASPEPGLDNILPTESDCSIMARTFPGTSPRPISDTAIAGPSQQEPDARHRHTVDHPSHG